MKRIALVTLIFGIVAGLVALHAGGRQCAMRALQVEELRALGPEGVERFFEIHKSELSVPEPAEPYRIALDRICAQRDCHASRLYWYTDLDQAKKRAHSLNRPILSLRLLGKLDEEYSCANSRYFRTALYANERVADLLRNRFVLHWESVRPAPVMRIDMGDGRTLKRTVTGNSSHFILTADGTILDVLPGLYGPEAFQELLQQILAIHDASRASPGRDWLREHHVDRLRSIQLIWSAKLQGQFPGPWVGETVGGFVDAYRAGLVAVTKAVVESPLVAPMSDPSELWNRSDDEAFRQLAAEYRERSRLDASSKRLLESKLRSHDPAQVEATIREFENRMALDSVRNELLLHRRIHQWFVEGEVDSDIAGLNERIYRELFLTPADDPWLGLVPPNAYAALDNDGIISLPND